MWRAVDTSHRTSMRKLKNLNLQVMVTKEFIGIEDSREPMLV